MFSLQKWYVHEYEHLGWMVLAKSKGDMDDKVNAYKHSIRRLVESIECKLETTKEEDRREDLFILLHDIKILHDFVRMNL